MKFVAQSIPREVVAEVFVPGESPPMDDVEITEFQTCPAHESPVPHGFFVRAGMRFVLCPGDVVVTFPSGNVMAMSPTEFESQFRASAKPLGALHAH